MPVKVNERCPYVWKDRSAKTIVCPLCGNNPKHAKTRVEIAFKNPATVLRQCSVRKLTHELGWGDRVHRLLGKFGVTPLRLAKFIAWWKGIDLEPARCGCRKRQEQLNQIGWRWKWRMSKVQWWFYEGMRRLLCPPCRRGEAVNQPASGGGSG